LSSEAEREYILNLVQLFKYLADKDTFIHVIKNVYNLNRYAKIN